jgi:hypothetical protein
MNYRLAKYSITALNRVVWWLLGRLEWEEKG